MGLQDWPLASCSTALTMLAGSLVSRWVREQRGAASSLLSFVWRKQMLPKNRPQLVVSCDCHSHTESHKGTSWPSSLWLWAVPPGPTLINSNWCPIPKPEFCFGGLDGVQAYALFKALLCQWVQSRDHTLGSSSREAGWGITATPAHNLNPHSWCT